NPTERYSLTQISSETKRHGGGDRQPGLWRSIWPGTRRLSFATGARRPADQSASRAERIVRSRVSWETLNHETQRRADPDHARRQPATPAGLARPAARTLQTSPVFTEARRRRQTLEHRLAQLVQLGSPQARYVGRTKALFQVLMTASPEFSPTRI